MGLMWHSGPVGVYQQINKTLTRVPLISTYTRRTRAPDIETNIVCHLDGSIQSTSRHFTSQAFLIYARNRRNLCRNKISMIPHTYTFFFKFYVSWSSPDFDPIFASLWAVGTNMQSLINWLIKYVTKRTLFPSTWCKWGAKSKTVRNNGCERDMQPC